VNKTRIREEISFTGATGFMLDFFSKGRGVIPKESGRENGSLGFVW
jgi:hypothetical protein